MLLRWAVGDILSLSDSAFALYLEPTNGTRQIVWVPGEKDAIRLPNREIVGMRAVHDHELRAFDARRREILTINRVAGVVEARRSPPGPHVRDAIWNGSQWYLLAGDSLDAPRIEALDTLGSRRVVSEGIEGFRTGDLQLGVLANEVVLSEIGYPFRLRALGVPPPARSFSGASVLAEDGLLGQLTELFADRSSFTKEATMRSGYLAPLAALLIGGLLVGVPSDLIATCLTCEDPGARGCLQEQGDGCFGGENPDGSEFCATSAGCEARISIEGIPAPDAVPEFVVASAAGATRRSCDGAIVDFGYAADEGARLRIASAAFTL